MNPTPTTQTPGLNPSVNPTMRLYMIEATVRDHAAAVSWLRDVVGFALLWHDVPRRFALFEIAPGGVRLAVKTRSSDHLAADTTWDPSEQPLAFPQRITFETDDLEATVAALSARNARLGPITDHPDEGYRKVKLLPPPGVELEVAIFGWTSDKVCGSITARAAEAR